MVEYKCAFECEDGSNTHTLVETDKPLPDGECSECGMNIWTGDEELGSYTVGSLA